jgi:RNA polymerase-binding transcription factor DksA
MANRVSKNKTQRFGNQSLRQTARKRQTKVTAKKLNIGQGICQACGKVINAIEHSKKIRLRCFSEISIIL